MVAFPSLSLLKGYILFISPHIVISRTLRKNHFYFTKNIRDLGALESALAQPQMTFDGVDLYPTLVDKAAALGFSLINNHPFVDGNKRVGQAAMEIFLILNGYEIEATVDEQEKLILDIAASRLKREDLVSWLTTHLISKER